MALNFLSRSHNKLSITLTIFIVIKTYLQMELWECHERRLKKKVLKMLSDQTKPCCLNKIPQCQCMTQLFIFHCEHEPCLCRELVLCLCFSEHSMRARRRYCSCCWPCRTTEVGNQLLKTLYKLSDVPLHLATVYFKGRARIHSGNK